MSSFPSHGPSLHPSRGTSRTAFAIPLVAFGLVLSGCSEIEDAFDCVDDERPAFSRTALPSPVLNQAYRETATVVIENSSADDRYGYDFELDGDLPPGMSWYADGRTVTFEGTPIETGTWSPVLGVRVRDGDGGVFGDDADAADLCRTRRSDTFTFEVAES